jgi:hypothetical protein
MKWRCFCGSTEITPTGYTRKGRWRIYADCHGCGRKLLFTKYGMHEIRKGKT